MTQIPEQGLAAQVAQVQAQVTNLHSSVKDIERSVNGDPAVNAPSLREAIKGLDGATDALCTRLDEIEQAAKIQESYLKGMTNVIKWLGGASLTGLLGLIGVLSGVFGGKP